MVTKLNGLRKKVSSRDNLNNDTALTTDVMAFVPYLETTCQHCQVSVPSVKKTCHLMPSHRNITKSSQTPKTNVFLVKEPSRKDHQTDSDFSQPVPAIKSRTTSVNGVAVVQSGDTNSKSKKTTKKRRAIEISDEEDDDSLEKAAALESPAKGVELRKTMKVSESFYIHLYSSSLLSIKIVIRALPRWKPSRLQVYYPSPSTISGLSRRL